MNISRRLIGAAARILAYRRGLANDLLSAHSVGAHREGGASFAQSWWAKL